MRACEFFFATPQIRAPDIFIKHAHIFENKKKSNSLIYFNENKLKISKSFRAVLTCTQEISFEQRKDNG